jgi:ADP-ribose pyrophosphatase YjhB (NUDIX family)
VAIAIRGHALQGLLMRRANAPFQGAKALSGSFVEIGEGLGSTTAKPISIGVNRSFAGAGAC